MQSIEIEKKRNFFQKFVLHRNLSKKLKKGDSIYFCTNFRPIINYSKHNFRLKVIADSLIPEIKKGNNFFNFNFMIINYS